MNTPSQGYVALISAVIISSLLLIVTFAVNFTNFFARFNILDSEFKKISSGLAEACVDTAILEIAKDSNWTPPAGGKLVTVTDASKTCKICEVSGSSPKIIKARSVYNKSYTNLEVAVSTTTDDVVIDRWEEKESYSGASCAVP